MCPSPQNTQLKNPLIMCPGPGKISYRINWLDVLYMSRYVCSRFYLRVANKFPLLLILLCEAWSHMYCTRHESGTLTRTCVSTCLCICLCVCLILCVCLHGCGVDGLHLFVHVYLLCVCLIVCEVAGFVCLCVCVCVHACLFDGL